MRNSFESSFSRGAESPWVTLHPDKKVNKDFVLNDSRDFSDSLGKLSKMTQGRGKSDVYFHVAYAFSDTWKRELSRLVEEYRGQRVQVSMPDGRQLYGYVSVELSTQPENMDNSGWHMQVTGGEYGANYVWYHDFLNGVEIRKNPLDTPQRVLEILGQVA